MAHLRPDHGDAARTAAVVVLLTLSLAACGGSDDGDQPPVPDSGTPTAGSPDPSTGDTSTSDQDPGATGASGPGGEVFAAIDLAEDEAGGTAFEVDHEDRDGGDAVWEISVAVGGDDVEVEVSLDGTEVLRSRSDGTLSPDERAGLDMATVSISDAVRIALAEVDGTLDEVDLERRGEGYAWEVGIDHGDGSDTDVHVDVVSGEIVEID